MENKYVSESASDSLEQNYMNIFFLRNILGDLYEGKHEQFIGKTYNQILNEMYYKVDDIFYRLKEQIAHEYGMKADDVGMDKICMPLDKEVFRKVKAYYKKCLQNY
jgi:hypothetical protein